MALVSDIIIQNPQVSSFADFENLVIERAKNGEIFLIFDIKPDFPDTPRDWQWRLESVFNRQDKLSNPLRREDK